MQPWPSKRRGRQGAGGCREPGAAGSRGRQGAAAGGIGAGGGICRAARYSMCAGLLRRAIAPGYCAWLLRLAIAPGYCAGLLRLAIAPGYCAWLLRQSDCYCVMLTQSLWPGTGCVCF